MSLSYRPVDPIALLKDAILAALVALIVALPLIGFRTVTQGGRIGLMTRFDWVAIGVAGVFFGRLLLVYVASFRPPSLPSFHLAVGFREGVGRNVRVLVALGLVLALLLPLLPFSSRYVIDVATGLLIYIMLGWGLNIVVGLAGLLDLGYVAFYAMGAYSYALLALHFELSFWVCLPVAGLFAGLLGIVLGFPVLRLRGDYLAIVTLGFGEIIRIILLNWYEMTGGPDGLSGIPRPSFFGLPFKAAASEDTTTFHHVFGLEFSGLHRVIFLYYLILFLALITNFFALRMRKLPLGRAWEALREDEIAARSLGINPRNTKLTAFGIGATFAGLAGAFFATRQGFISPESFTFAESATILAIVVLGGMGSQVGVVVAATVLILLPELGRALEEFRMLMFGAAMVLIMAWRPRGLLANREPTLRLHRPGDPRADPG